MFSPKKFKFKKQQKGKFFNKIYDCSVKQLRFGNVGLKVISFGKLNSKQVETMRKIVKKDIKQIGKIIFNIFPSIAVTKKPLETRMGKGKGAVDAYVVKLKPGLILFEIITERLPAVINTLYLLKKKLGINTKIVFI